MGCVGAVPGSRGCASSTPGTSNVDRGTGSNLFVRVYSPGPLQATIAGRTLEDNYQNQHFQSCSTKFNRRNGFAGAIVSGRLQVRAMALRGQQYQVWTLFRHGAKEDLTIGSLFLCSLSTIASSSEKPCAPSCSAHFPSAFPTGVSAWQASCDFRRLCIPPLRLQSVLFGVSYFDQDPRRKYPILPTPPTSRFLCSSSTALGFTRGMVVVGSRMLYCSHRGGV